ncbi:unnamed protein product [Mytilus coruscus]|uniref:TSPAN9 n=1 Tax=Mytilus coruscus TaxID=42192 RepID=A0A6J8B9X4_MYTCO|nr:unnamed protein product [Mytilus coruscus]
MMAIYIKVGDDILDTDVIKVADMQDVAGMPLGTTVKSIVFSLIGVFALELLTGIFGIWGVIGHRKPMLMIKSCFRDTLFNYIQAYEAGPTYISSTYFYNTFPNFLSMLGCEGRGQSGIYYCYEIYNEQLTSYLQIYFGLIVTCIVCQIVGAGLLGLGLTLIGDEFIHDNSLKHIFYQIQFYNYYFYDILVGLAASSVVIGILTMVIAIFGLVGSWKKSSPVLIMINDNMRFQLELQQQGYYYNNHQGEITRRWNDMILKIVGLIFTNKEYSQIKSSDIHEIRSLDDSTEAPHSMTIMFRTVFGLIKSFLTSTWKRSKISLLHFILLGIMAVCNIGTLVLAIHVRYDYVFGNSDIQALLSKLRIADHTFTRALNMFSIVVVTFSSTSIAVIIFAVISIASMKWKRLLLLISVGLWSVVTVANVVQIGLWGKFIATADTELEDLISTELINNTYTYQHSHASGYFNRETSLSWNMLFVKAECCGVGINITNSLTTSYWYMYRRDSTSQRIPVQCCKSQTEVYPYANQYDTDCTNNLLNGYYRSQGCDKVIVNRLDLYSLVFFVIMGINVLAEIGMIATTMYNAVSLTKEENAIRVRYGSGEDNVELNEITGNTTPKSVQR